MRFITALLMAAFSLPAFAHHQGDHPDQHLIFAGHDVHAHVFWEVQPTDAEEVIARIEFRKPSDHSAVGITGQLSVTVSMPDMDHGQIPTDIVQVLDESGNPQLGVFRVSNIYFFMNGRWEVSVSLTAADGTVETQKFDVMIGGGDGNGGHHH